MSYRYKVKPSSSDSHQADYYWLAIVVPFSIKNTIARRLNTISSPILTFTNISSDEANKDPVLVESYYLLDSEIIRWQTSCSKESHISTLNMTLMPETFNYVSEMAPEDWIIFWAFDNYESYKTVKDNLNSSPIKPCNLFTDSVNTAPKFVGRIDSIMLNKSIEPNTGRASATYAVNCVGFSELDSSIYFDQRIEPLWADAALFWNAVSNAETEITAAGIITTQEAIVGLLQIFLGIGPGEASTSFGLKGVAASPNQAYLIPNVIKDIIPRGSNVNSNKTTTYADLLRIVVGVQKYQGAGASVGKSFMPLWQDGRYTTHDSFDDLVDGKPLVTHEDDLGSFDSKNGVYRTFQEVTGTFNQPILSFNNTPLWSSLKTFVLEPVNEIYTCLRVGPDGKVCPTLIIRQQPLSTQEFAEQNKNNATAFMDLPCWDIDSTLVQNIQVGRSNAMRYNYMLITPNDMSQDPQVASDVGRFLSNPVIDEADIRRAGLRGLILNQSFANAQNDQILQKDASFWNRMMADILFGSHLKYSGTITTAGISVPICQGDNCIVDGMVYHIERIIHLGSIDASGRKSFITNLQVSNGLVDDGGKDQDNAYPGILADTGGVADPTSTDLNIGTNWENE